MDLFGFSFLIFLLQAYLFQTVDAGQSFNRLNYVQAGNNNKSLQPASAACGSTDILGAIKKEHLNLDFIPGYSLSSSDEIYLFFLCKVLSCRAVSV